MEVHASSDVYELHVHIISGVTSTWSGYILLLPIVVRCLEMVRVVAHRSICSTAANSIRREVTILATFQNSGLQHAVVLRLRYQTLVLFLPLLRSSSFLSVCALTHIRTSLK